MKVPQVLKRIDYMGTIAGVLLGLLVWTYIAANREAIVYVDTPSDIVETCAGEMFVLERSMIFKRDLDLTISRSLVKENEDGTTDTIQLNEISLKREEGYVSQKRRIYTPYGLENDVYTLRTFVTVHEFPFWNIRNEAPSVTLNVAGRCDDYD